MCIVSQLFSTQTPHLCLWFSCTIPNSLGPLNVLLQRLHLETMSGSNDGDKLEKNTLFISLILMCNTVTLFNFYHSNKHPIDSYFQL